MSKAQKKLEEKSDEVGVGQPYFFPEFQLTINAASMEDALKQLSEMQANNKATKE